MARRSASAASTVGTVVHGGRDAPGPVRPKCFDGDHDGHRGIRRLPGAYLLELGPWGMRPAAWEDLSLVIAWRQFMRDPRSYFRHLFEEL